MLKFLCCCVAAIAVTTMATAQPRFMWAKPLRGPGVDQVTSISIAPNGSLYASGSFLDSLQLDSNLTILSNKGYDGFLGRYNLNGRAMSGFALGGVDADESRQVVTDKDNNVYVTGTFFDLAQIGAEIIEASDESTIDAYVAKFDRFGSLKWTAVFGSVEYSEGNPYLAIDSSGNVYVGLTIGGTSPYGNDTYTALGSSDIVVVKLNSNGQTQWFKGMGATGIDVVTSVSVTPTGDRIYVTGTFEGTCVFGESETITSFERKSDGFVMGLNGTGKVDWVKRIGSREVDREIVGALDVNGDLMVAGTFFGTTSFGNINLNANGGVSSDFYLARVKKDGSTDFVQAYGGPFEEAALAIATDKFQGTYLTGYFNDEGKFGSEFFESYGKRDGWIARFGPAGEIEWVRRFGGPENDVGLAVAVDKDNIPYVAGEFETRCTFLFQTITAFRNIDGFIAALECGPNTAFIPTVDDTIRICEGQDTAITVFSGNPSYEWFNDGSPVNSVTRERFPLETLTIGEHRLYVRIRDRYDCSGISDTITVIVREGLPKPAIVREGMQLTCTLDGYTYTWIRDGGVLSAYTTKMITAPGNGRYRVRVSDGTGCTRVSDEVVVGTVNSVDDAWEADGLRLYPNPTRGDITIDGLAEGDRITLVDAVGRVMTTQTATSSDVVINMSDMTPGLYVVSITTPTGLRTRLVMKR